MQNFFVKLPGFIAEGITHNFMTVLTFACVGLPIAWVVLFFSYERHRKTVQARRNVNRIEPGAFPGDRK